jgi:hypothetical protein
MKNVNNCGMNIIVVWTSAFLLSSTPVRADNSVTVDGHGGGNVNLSTVNTEDSVIDIYQVGNGAFGQENVVGDVVSPIAQAGNGNVARIGQGARYVEAGSWAVEAAVVNNFATIDQQGQNNLAVVNQLSNANQARIKQDSGEGVAAVITQNGAAASLLTVHQGADAAYTLTVNQSEGGGHSAIIETLASYVGGDINVSQNGVGNSASVLGMAGSDGSGLTIDQSGANNTAAVTGMSGGNANISQSGTNGTVLLAGQSGGSLNISQQGQGSFISIDNYGFSQALSISQNGAATSYNP